MDMDTKSKNRKAIFFAILAAALYAISSPVSKILLNEIPATMMAALLYLGAGIGMVIVRIIQKQTGYIQKEQPLTRNEMPYTIGMVLLDITAPILLMIGLKMTTSANVSLLNNFEIVATSIIALFVFKEAISKRLWLAIALVTLASIILSVDDMSSFKFSSGSFLVLLACVCWGFENNCTRKMSAKDPLQIVVIKGFGSGAGSLAISFFIGETTTDILFISMALLLGFVAYGLSVFFYVYAQRELGAAKTSTYYAFSPFIGVMLSLMIFREQPSVTFTIALLIMAIGTYFTIIDSNCK